MSDTPQRAHPAPSADLSLPLDGGWFRRERERVALGRKRVAERLGITESRLAVLESRKQMVPIEWLPVLAGLEFRVPSLAKEVSAANVESEIVAPPPPVVTPVEAIPNMTPSLPAVAAPVAAPVSVPAPVVAPLPTPVSVPAPPVLPPAVVAESAPAQIGAASSSFFCGHWLRERRRSSSLRTDQILAVLGCSDAELQVMEEHNIRLPLRYISRLQKLSLLSAEEVKVASKLRSTSRLDGIWLERQRAQLRMNRDQLGLHLHASASAIALIESKAWPIPAAWIPIVESLHKARGAEPQTDPVLRSFTRSFGASRRLVAPPPPPLPLPRGPQKGKEALLSAAAKEAPPPPPVTVSPPVRPAPPPPAATPPVAKAKPAPIVSQGGLAESIVEERLRFGRRVGLSANQVLSLIAQDFLVAKIQIPLSHDAVAAAMRTLLHHKPGPV